MAFLPEDEHSTIHGGQASHRLASGGRMGASLGGDRPQPLDRPVCSSLHTDGGNLRQLLAIASMLGGPTMEPGVGLGRIHTWHTAEADQ